MAKASEEISKYKANSSAKPDSNIANDSLHLGGIDADEYATKDYVQKYHNTKEEKLKQDISNQDKTVLEEAKAYSDEIVKSQDFSGFAKVTDVQAIDDKLSQKISNQGTEQKNYTDGRIQSVVNDVNTNFDNVGKSIESLNNSTNQLFQSVSDGKSKVAAAITDKGVDTASNASFDDMANNIKNISTSGGDIPTDPNFVNTGDATAEAADIKAGKIAYSKGSKIYGTYVEKDSTTGVPTYGTDTSGATATEADIAMGKTAWANGVLLTGNAIFNQSTEVEEIYGTSEKDYDIIDGANVGITKYPDTEDTVTQRFIIAFSKDANYCVSAVRLNGSTSSTDYAIESHIVTDSGLQIQGSASDTDGIIYKKYRYTKGELGLNDTEIVMAISLGAAGILHQNNQCLLMIVTYDTSTSKRYMHFYTYHLHDNGVIGKAYDNEKYIVNNYIVDCTNEIKTDENWNSFIFANTDSTVLFILGYKMSPYKALFKKLKINIYADNENSESLQISPIFYSSYFGNYSSSSYKPPTNDITLTKDDKYVTFSSLDRSLNYITYVLIKLDANLSFEASYSYAGLGTILPLNDEKAIIIPSYATINFKLVSLSVSGVGITVKDEKNVYSKYEENSSRCPLSAILTNDAKKIIIFWGEYNGTYLKPDTFAVSVFKVDDILNAEASTYITPIQKQELSTFSSETIYGSASYITYDFNYNFSKIVTYLMLNSEGSKGYLCILNNEEDKQNLLGIKYKNEFFRKTEKEQFTATPSDVAIGKTFIGKAGEAETGTMEV